MEPENLFIAIKEILDYLEKGPKQDPYFYEKQQAMLRRLNYRINEVKCDELRNIIKKKVSALEKHAARLNW